MSPASIEARIPPPLVRATSAPVASSIASATNCPKLVSLVRTFSLAPSSITVEVPIFSDRISFSPLSISARSATTSG